MKIVHMIAGDLSGGAAKGAYWLHQGLLKIGMDSKVLTNAKGSIKDPTVATLLSSPAKKITFALQNRLLSAPQKFYLNRKDRYFSTGDLGVNFLDHEFYRAADVVHMHWINGLVSLKAMNRIKKPTVWTLRDMWPFTGGCHYPEVNCTRYRESCGACPQLRSHRDYDLSRRIFERKKQLIPQHTVLVGISEWLSQSAKSSALLNDFDIRTIPNNIDTKIFKPADPVAARLELNLPANKKIILIGAQSLHDHYKGAEIFADAMTYIDRSDVHIAIFGRESSALGPRLPHPSSDFGFIRDENILRLLYACADVFCAPSVLEAFGKTLAEAQACGTPVVCFESTGAADVIAHQKTGYKSKLGSAYDLAMGIKWVLSRSICQMDDLRRCSRDRAQSLFDKEKVALQYKALYGDLIGAPPL
jgi:glycosyltransferase involved in cell wall biosynthesis